MMFGLVEVLERVNEGGPLLRVGIADLLHEDHAIGEHILVAPLVKPLVSRR